MSTREIWEHNRTIIVVWCASIRLYLNIRSGRRVMGLDERERDMYVPSRLLRRTNLLLSAILKSIRFPNDIDDADEPEQESESLYETVHGQIYETTYHLSEVMEERIDKPAHYREMLWSKLFWDAIMGRMAQIMRDWMALTAPDLIKKLEDITQLHLGPKPKRGQKAELWLFAARELGEFGIPKKDISRTLKLLIIGSIVRPYLNRLWAPVLIDKTRDKPFSSQQLNKLMKPFNSGYFSTVMAKAGYVDQERQKRGWSKKPRSYKDSSAAMLRSSIKKRLAKVNNAVRFLRANVKPTEQSLLYIEQLERAAMLSEALIDRRKIRILDLKYINLMNRSEGSGNHDTSSWSRYIAWFEQQDRFIKDPEKLSRLKQLPVFEPAERDEAIMCGYYGMPCPRCKRWRVKKERGYNVQCTACQHIFKAQIVTRCRYCSEIIHVYEEDCVVGLRCPYCGTLSDLSAASEHVLRFTARQLRQKKGIL